MRTILACAACRRLKTKCVHNGKPPCRACVRGHRENSCGLSMLPRHRSSLASASSPRTSKRQQRRSLRSAKGPLPEPESSTQEARQESLRLGSPISPAHTDQLGEPDELGAGTAGARTTALELEGATATSSTSTPAPPSSTPPSRPNDHSANNRCNSNPEVASSRKTSSPIPATPKDLLVQSGWAVIHKFPEFAFIHPPSFLAAIQDGSVDHVQMCAVMALAGRFLPDVQLHGIDDSPGIAGDVYADYVRSQLSWQALERPSITTVQCLLLLAMYEWGSSLGFRTWMYLGMAIRMAQTLKYDLDSPVTEMEREIYKRTVWSCFLIDRVTSCGKDRSMAFDLKEMKLAFPVADSQFIYGIPARENTDHPHLLGIDHQFTILLQGIDIWTAASKWTTNGGRRACHGLEDCPWKPSSTWYHITQRLEDWHNQQEELTMWYSPARLTAHIRGGYAESFAFINLIYYMCLVFMHREFIPLLPLRANRPQGPIDPPFYPEDAPSGWWDKSIRTLQESADCITDILQQLDQAQHPLMTPFIGFCGFTASTIHVYFQCFPHMTGGHPIDANQQYGRDLEYLQKFETVWKIGRSWIGFLDDAQRLYRTAMANPEQFRMATRYDYLGLEMKQYEYGDIQATAAATRPQPSVEAPSAVVAAEGEHNAVPTLLPEGLSRIPEPSETSMSMADVAPYSFDQLDHNDIDFWRQVDLSIMGDGPSMFRDF